MNQSAVLFSIFIALSSLAAADVNEHVGVWNRFLSQKNIVECFNTSNAAVSFRLIVRRSSGELLETLPLSLSGKGGTHVDLNQFLATDQHGTIVIESDQPNAAAISCQTAFYRQDLNRPGGIEYAYAIPFLKSVRGEVGGSFNSINPTPGEAAVLNWISVVVLDHDSTSFVFDLLEYNAAGTIIRQTPIALNNFGGRIDLPLGHPDGQQVGLYRIIPRSNARSYSAFLMRYSQTETGYRFAFPLFARKESCERKTVPASTMGPALNWLELINPTSRPLPVTVTVNDQLGVSLASQAVTLRPFGQQHLGLNAILGEQNVGSVTIDCANPSQNGFLVQSAYYGSRAGAGISWAYASQPREVVPFGRRIAFPYNTNLSAANWVKLHNESTAASAIRELYRLDSSLHSNVPFYLAPSQDAQIGLHEDVGADASGLVTIDPGVPGASMSAELIRVFADANGISTIMRMDPWVMSNPTLCEPKLSIATQSVNENRGGEIAFQRSDSCPGAQNIRVVGNPHHGTVTYENGHLRFVPEPGFVGTAQFTVVLEIDGIASAPVTVFVEVMFQEMSGISESLAAYHDNVTEVEINHLLKRVAFGVRTMNYRNPASGQDENVDLVQYGLAHGLQALADLLLNAEAASTVEAKAIAFKNADGGLQDWQRPLWISSGQAFRYTIAQMLFSPPLKAFMELRLFDWFPVNIDNIAAGPYWQSVPEYLNTAIRGNSLGNFRTLVRQLMKSDLGMNEFLNNDQNYYNAQLQREFLNENYARELLELHLMGPKSCNGSANYDTVNDVKTLARALTGFQMAYRSDGSSSIFYNPAAHVSGTKRLFAGYPYERTFNISAALDCDTEECEPTMVLDYLLYSVPQVRQYIGQKLYTMLVNPYSNCTVAQQVGDLLIENNYELKPIIKKLITSQAMFAPVQREFRAIRSPLETLVGYFRRLGFTLTANNGFPNDFWAALRDARMPLLLLDNPFGYYLDGTFNHLGANYGDVWLGEPQLVLQKKRMSLHNTAVFYDGINYTSFFLPNGTSTTAAQLVDSLASKVGVTLSQSIRQKLIAYVNQDRVNGRTVFTATVPDLVYRKVNGVLMILTELPEFHTK